MRAISDIEIGRRIVMPGLLLALALIQPTVALKAQTVLGTASLYQDALPHKLALPDDDDITGSTDAAVATGVVRTDATEPRLRHLPMSDAGWRITGEVGNLAWRVFMTETEAAQTHRFRISYTPAVSVLPDLSTIALVINGLRLGQVGMATPGELKPLEFAIPSSLLRAGYNDVRIAVDERHRVDCSTDATYELSTEIEPDNTGFLSARNLALPELSDLAALRPRADGRLAIRILLDGKMKRTRMEQAIVAAQAVALAAKAAAPVVGFTPEPDADFGVNLAIGTADELTASLKAFPEHPVIRGPAVFLTRSSAEGAPALIVTGLTDEDVSAALAQLSASATPDVGTRVGEAASGERPRIAGGETLRLQDLGLSNLEFSGGVFHVPITVELPPDLLVADYGRLSINLSGAYAAGLLAGAQVQVSLNGKQLASAPLSNASGGRFRHDDVFIPMSGLRPGPNVIEIAAKLPSATDKACDAMVPADERSKRFLLLGDTEIHFPHLARVGQMPELAQTAAGGYPYSLLGSKPTLYIPKPDRDAMSAALTLTVRIAIAAGRPVPFDLVLSNPTRQTGHSIVVAPAQSLDPGLMTDIGLDPDAVRRAWTERAAGLEAPGTKDAVVAAAGASRSDQVQADLQDALPTNVTRVNFDVEHTASVSRPSAEWNAILAPRTLFDRGADVAVAAWNGLSDRVTATGASVKSMIWPAATAFEPESSLIIAQGYRNGDIPGVTAIVTAPDSKTLARSVEALVEPQHWSELAGRLAVIDESGRILDSVKARNIHFAATQPPSIGNWRLIAAGWLSLHPFSFVAVALMLAGLLAVFSHLLVRNIGRANA